MTTDFQATPAAADPYAPLIDKYEKWLAETGYLPRSADELLHELLYEGGHSPERLDWLRAYIEEWEAVERARPRPPLEFDKAKQIVLDLARQNLAPEDMPDLRAMQVEACDTIEELAVNFHETD